MVQSKTPFIQLASKIKTFIFDVDGVFTNGQLFILPSGEQVRNMNVKDGYAVQLAKRKGYNVCIISGGNSETVRKRFYKLGVHDVFMDQRHKPDALDEFLLIHDLDPEEAVYVGDDLPDYDVMLAVGARACPADAAPEIQQICHLITQAKGGEGCVREVIEKVLKIQGNWLQTTQKELPKEFRW